MFFSPQPQKIRNLFLGIPKLEVYMVDPENIKWGFEEGEVGNERYPDRKKAI